VGVVERMVGPGLRQMSRAYMPDQHREFYAQLPFVVLGSVDPNGDVWATLRAGQPGFMQSLIPERLRLKLAREPDDPADAGMEEGDGIGMLGIELHTRRRNRLNGNVRRTASDGFEIEVTQAYGNCPQYIQLRNSSFVTEPPGSVTHMTTLSPQARSMIEAADSFYVASYVVRDGVRQVDASHRGGKPGFIDVSDDGTLTIPDFSGNLFFNTLGNFLLNPRAGLVFVNFRSGDLLQMTGSAEVVLDAPEIAAFMGAERMWRFRPRTMVFRPAALPLRWNDIEQGISPNVLLTGSWDDAAARMKAAELAQRWRPYRIERIVDESVLVRSFYLTPSDGAGMPRSLAGQHLPIRLALPDSPKPAIRTYTLSSAPSDPQLRISVKRQGPVSAHLHTALKTGDIVEARAPAGSFTIDASVRRPAVLIAAGVGVTPLLSMARHLIHEGKRTRYLRPAWLFQAARNRLERAFDDELSKLVEDAKGGLRVIRVLTDTRGAEAGKDYEESGRISVEVLKRHLPFEDYDFYLCGPAEFMQQMYDALRNMSIADKRIHAEAFGPAGVMRTADLGAAPVPAGKPASGPVPVLFMQSAKEARWEPGSGTLLELAEQRGLSPESSCRGGSCGTCRTRVLKGSVAYTLVPSFDVPADEALICCSLPADGCAALHLDL
jgi:ferredoxin-NADP reductase/predicted pyridoxine 5'-phosphate oxidase superfamily flavin-nucleotide-binding protein